MSRLKELRLHGFKSFADPTRFVFEPGVNAVIGPNGSGKSNMADAVRWVLGEQSNRSLRTRRADDVIFGGSDQRRPQGMAEAILTLDNADGWLPIDFAEVAIGRRAYRSGESEYLINGARARLRDVVELLGEGRLGANELVVVGQGTVDAALSLRPEERRQLFEEAAGVKGLQVRRNEATVRLARSRDNLTRVSDLIAELKPQVRRLALQAEHQQQHDTLGVRARSLVMASHRRREQAARGALGDARRRAAAAEAALEAHRSAREASRAAIAEAEERYWEAEEASRRAGAARQETREELIRAEGRLEAVTARESELTALLDHDEHELVELESLVGHPEGVDSEAIDPALAAAMSAEREWEAAVAALAAADDELVAAEHALADLRVAQSDRIAAQARADEELARHEARLTQAQREREAAEAGLTEATRAADAAVRTHTEAIRAAATALADLEARGTDRDAAQEAADTTRHAAVELAERLQATRAELDALAEPHDAGTRLGRRLAAAGWQSLLDVIEAPEASWPAIEAVVGGELESVLLWADHDPSVAIDGARGAARLLAPANGAGTAEGDRGLALAAVNAERTLAEWVGMTASTPTAFTRTAVAADLPALLDGWRRLPPGWAAVTPQGDLADARGVILRGRGDPPGGASARAHARRRELMAAVGDLEERHASAQRAAHEAAEALRSARTAHLAARDMHDQAERAVRVAREGREAADAAVQRLSERAGQAARELTAIEAGPPESEISPSGPGTDRLGELHALADNARSRRDALVRRRDEARAAWTATRREAEELQTRVAGVTSERATRETRVAQLRGAVPERRAAIASIRDERLALDASLSSARSAVDAAESASAAAEAARAERRAELQALEREEDGGSGRLAELERAAQVAAIESSRRDEALASLLREREMALESLPEVEGGAADTAPTDDIDALDDEALESELRRVRRTLAQIGSVNPFAVEEHRDLAARLEEMTAQDSDLSAAIASTEELIASLDAEITAQFDAAFKAIGERFDEFCRLLFAGGSASLQLADEADGDAPGGIEIVVRPPGKRLQRLAMLSGGERALTGVALLFAMLTVNPVPFCILDEVDAALDEANIGRFAEALRRLSESIDFVVITHNRATIEVADTIYGVTMTDAAVSRVLSLRLSDVPAGVGA